MRRLRTIGLAVAAAVALTAVGVVPASADSDAPAATDVGITAKEVHVATIADVDNPFSPGLFEGAKIGAQAAAKYLNSKQGGNGIGGRKLVVDFYDSKLNANEARNAVIKACQDDFAMVASSMLFLTSADDLKQCPDQSGAPTGLPDLAAFATSVVEGCAPTVYPVGGSTLDCETAFDSPQRYTQNAGFARYLVHKYGKGELHGPMLYGTDTKDAQRASEGVVQGFIEAGLKPQPLTGLSARTPQSGYTPVVTQMKANGANFAMGYNGNVASFKSEAQLQGVPDSVLWIGAGYGTDYLKNPTYNDTYFFQFSLPPNEANANAMLKTYLEYVGYKNSDTYSTFGWAATLAFAQAARHVVEKDGVNGLTRKAFLEQGIPTLTKFSADGLVGTADIASRQPSPCFMALQIVDGKIKRVTPKKPGTFDCNPKNLVTFEADYIGG